MSSTSSATATRRRFRPLCAFLAWLRNVPIDNPVDRRNAPMVQILLLLMCVGVPVLSLPRWITVARGAEPIDYLVEVINAATIFMVYLNLWLLRRGFFKRSVELFLSMSLVLMAVSYWHTGLDAEVHSQVTQAFPLVLGGLLLGRRTLWLIVLAMLIIFGIGTLVDVSRDVPGMHGEESHWITFIRSGIGFLVIAIILDRAVSALRETLDLAHHHGEALERTQRALQQEILEKERSQAMLVQSQKIEAVGRVSSGLAHDFNNILGVIMGYASKPDAFERHEVALDSLEGIKLAAQRGAIAIRRILGLGRKQLSTSETFDARIAIADMQPLIQQIFGQRIALVADLPDQPLPVHLDRAEFELAVLNIIGNARDAMPHGGTFTLKAVPDIEHIDLQFADTGQGMSPEAREHLFEPFFTTKSAGLGSGLGLAAVKHFVDKARGSIRVESVENVGTTVHIRLPAGAGWHVPSPPHSVTGLRVLLVEDDEALRTLLADALRSAGAEVMASGSGQDALHLAETAKAIDVLVCDFHLPDADTCDTLKQIGTLHPTMRCVVITTDETLVSLKELGTKVKLLGKPFEPVKLVEVVAAVGCSE